MTDEEIEEIKELVARKLGWLDIKDGLGQPPEKQSGDNGYVIPDYACSIEAAWEIVEKLRSDGWRVIITVEGLNWACTIGTWLHEELAETAPLAICRAFLKLP